MSFQKPHHIPLLLGNRDMNELYASISLSTFAQSLISIFVPIYLYNLGYSIPYILFFFFLISLSYVAVAYPIAKIVSKNGTKHAILYSTPFIILYYITLLFLPTYSFLFYVAPLFISLRGTLFNFGVHLDFVEHSQSKNVGREVSLYFTIHLISAALGPLIGGLLTAFFGFSVLFTVGTVILFFSVIPLFLTPDIFEEIPFTFKSLMKETFNRTHRGSILSFAGYAIESIIGRTLWPLFLIILLVSISSVGTVVTISLLLSVTIFYFIGTYTDRYNKKKLIKIGSILYFFGWIGRLFVDSSLKVVLIDSYKNISEKVLQIPWLAYSIDLSIRQGYFRFIVSREIIFNLSRILLFPILIMIFIINYHPFIISFLIASFSSLLYMYLNE